MENTLESIVNRLNDFRQDLSAKVMNTQRKVGGLAGTSKAAGVTSTPENEVLKLLCQFKGVPGGPHAARTDLLADRVGALEGLLTSQNQKLTAVEGIRMNAAKPKAPPPTGPAPDLPADEAPLPPPPTQPPGQWGPASTPSQPQPMGSTTAPAAKGLQVWGASARKSPDAVPACTGAVARDCNATATGAVLSVRGRPPARCGGKFERHGLRGMGRQAVPYAACPGKADEPAACASPAVYVTTSCQGLIFTSLHSIDCFCVRVRV